MDIIGLIVGLILTLIGGWQLYDIYTDFRENKKRTIIIETLMEIWAEATTLPLALFLGGILIVVWSMVQFFG